MVKGATVQMGAYEGTRGRHTELGKARQNERKWMNTRASVEGKLG